MITLLATALLTIGCGKKESETTDAMETAPEPAAQNGAGTAQDSAAAMKAPFSGEAVAENVAGFSTEGIVAAYLKLQDALTKDDARAAAQAGKVLHSEFAKVDATAIDQKKRAEYLDIAEDAKEHAEHISHNASDIAHQREHLAVLSKDISDLVTAFGSNTKLYQDHCLMYSDGKGAIWLSASKQIRNPYYGKAMLSCGTVQKEF